MEKMSYEMRVQAVLDKFNEYNKINDDIKRFGIFNSFNVSHQIEKEYLYFEIRNTDNEEFDLLTSASSEQSIQINLHKDSEFNWLIKTMNRFIEKSKVSMKKAREIAKPQVGILVYDEFTDSYFLNPTSGPVLLKSKEIMKEIASTRLDIFGIFINLRSALIESDRRSEIIGDSFGKVLDKIKESVKNIQNMETKLRKIEGIPRYICDLKEVDAKISFESFATVDFGVEILKFNKFNEYDITGELDDMAFVESLYIKIRKIEETCKQMIDLGRSLISKNDPNLYNQDSSTKLWILTHEGRETMSNLNIMDFINNDISEVSFEIN
ncbi:hypothetical protein SCHIN_v1c06170 [Spiroplasma chinense]|uniref:Uncharacterized protein n=1 Tax=Spiroplasma chinense TaxID=216932 RepID=A0A5B9Y416_9MOLU|nr:hypothetical protein [Spiroplasma chinense]QEH61814.1 hypothetical protein SCHIN_v1c06170 [Spiroplasma chinense]